MEDNVRLSVGSSRRFCRIFVPKENIPFEKKKTAQSYCWIANEDFCFFELRISLSF